MKYCTYSDVLNMGGFQPQDIFDLGYEMSVEQLHAYVDGLIEICSNMINRYCNVEDFSLHTVDEYYTLDIGDSFTPIYGLVRGYPGLSYSVNLYDYTTDLNKFTIIPRWQPVNEITHVYINNAWSYAQPNWEEVQPYTSTSSGDYKIVERYGTTKIVFVRRFPCPSLDNIHVVYTCGYDTDHDIWTTLKLCCAMMCNNILMYKKRNQEAATIRGAGVRDYTRMFGNNWNSAVLTPDIAAMLDLYKRDPLSSFTSD